jgi:lipopolysaccharide/colanic/teichoic acid biosynthesis glycosyltransferase
LGEILGQQYSIDTYPNGMALHYALQKHVSYKIILSDDEVNGVNGAPLSKTLKKLGYGNIPFITFVNKIDNQLRRDALAAGFTDFFKKPLDPTAIKIRLQFIAEHHNKKPAANITSSEFKLPFLKRLFDITFSGLALLCLAPIFLIIAILIRLESKGPVFYYSLRVGSGYRVFKFFKLRSMYTGADAKLKDLKHLNQYNLDAPKVTPTENNSVKQLCDLCEAAGTGCQYPLYTDDKVICEVVHKQQKAHQADSAFIKIKDDPRITKVGKFIRNTSIDELPQLWNVFIGDMSIVGNRPLPLYEAEKITTDRYALRFMAPAGITGLWQVEKRGKGDMSEDERLQLDNKYAKCYGFFYDIKLILRTIPALFQTANV